MKYDVIIAPSFAQVETWRKRCAEELRSGLFAQVVTTFDAWIADLWELHGDGRAIISDAQRHVIMHAVFDRAGESADASGVVSLAASCMRAAAGVAAFEESLALVRGGCSIDGASPQETAFLAMLAQYEDAIAQLGLIELGCAAADLAHISDQVFPQVVRVLLPDAPPFSRVQKEFFETCSHVEATVRPAPGMDGIAPAPEGVDVHFAFPSGRLAEPGLVADAVMECSADGDIAVVCKDPLDLCARVQERLTDAGFKVCAQARKPFARTDFGKAYLAMARCVHADPWDAVFVSDVVFSPFSGFSQADAFKVDASVRANRIAERENVLATLRAASELFSQLEELASEPDADVLIGVFEQVAQASAQRSGAWRSEQLAAMSVLRETLDAARRVNAGIPACVSVLEQATVPVSVCGAGTGNVVTFTTQALAARMGQRAVCSLIVVDLTSEDYPVADKDDAAATLLTKLGLEPEESALSRARRQFTALCSVAGCRLIMMRPLHDSNADETYPAVVLEEFVDAYRPDASATDDIDNAYRLPAQLQDGLVERGEELLFANACAADEADVQRLAARVPVPDMGSLGSCDASLVMAPRRNSQGNALARPCPSPSQIEVYLECPYQWFATRRLHIQALDEGFGPLERGTFAHTALETFYRRFREAGYAKVSEGNLPDARALMGDIVGELAEAQFAEEPGSGRLVYASELERREVSALCRQLVSYLDYEAKLLPTFHPVYLEYEIDVEHAVDYAGYSLVGKIDRIDMDDRGHAVIIDYKGSVNPEHEIAGKGADHVGKTQTRIYAQVVKRALGLDVVGALYVSYGRKPTASGAYDPRVLEAVHLPGMRHDKCKCGTVEGARDELPSDYALADLSFGAMLDETEQLASNAISRMCAGEVAPNPAYPKACAYCPVLACSKRGA